MTKDERDRLSTKAGIITATLQLLQLGLFTGECAENITTIRNFFKMELESVQSLLKAESDRISAIIDAPPLTKEVLDVIANDKALKDAGVTYDIALGKVPA